jgi:hypothetical protein
MDETQTKDYIELLIKDILSRWGKSNRKGDRMKQDADTYLYDYYITHDEYLTLSCEVWKWIIYKQTFKHRTLGNV